MLQFIAYKWNDILITTGLQGCNLIPLRLQNDPVPLLA